MVGCGRAIAACIPDPHRFVTDSYFSQNVSYFVKSSYILSPFDIHISYVHVY